MYLREQLTVISTLTFAEMKGRYRNTVAGVLWVMFNPLIMFGVHALIFKHILKVPIGLLTLPLSLLLLFCAVTYMAVFLATLQVFFRDTQYITNFILSVMFFLTPIFYPRSLIPPNYQIFVDLNPFYAFIQTFKISLWTFTIEGYLQALMSACLFLSFIMAITVLLWKNTRNELYINI